MFVGLQTRSTSGQLLDKIKICSTIRDLGLAQRIWLRRVTDHIGLHRCAYWHHKLIPEQVCAELGMFIS